MSKIPGIFGAAIVCIGFAMLPHAAVAQSACVAGGPLSMDNAYVGAAEGIAKQVRRNAAITGAANFKLECTFQVICVSTDNSKEAFINAKLRCKTVREGLMANLADQRKSKAKTNLITLIAKRPRDGFRPASVHISYK